MDWTSEVRGIKPWPGARVLSRDKSWLVVRTPPPARGAEWFEIDSVVRSRIAVADAVLDLTHADTRSGFDRRLAVGLGAPEEVADQGVVFYWDGRFWRMNAGVAAWEWCGRDLEVIEEQPLLARVMAWRRCAVTVPLLPQC